MNQDIQITFNEFNINRENRSVPAARFDIVYDDGETDWLWMSQRDIEKNITQFPWCKAELEKGLQQYQRARGKK